MDFLVNRMYFSQFLFFCLLKQNEMFAHRSQYFLFQNFNHSFSFQIPFHQSDFCRHLFSNRGFHCLRIHCFVIVIFCMSLLSFFDRHLTVTTVAIITAAIAIVVIFGIIVVIVIIRIIIILRSVRLCCISGCVIFG